MNHIGNLTVVPFKLISEGVCLKTTHLKHNQTYQKIDSLKQMRKCLVILGMYIS